MPRARKPRTAHRQNAASAVSPVARPKAAASPWRQPGRSGENLDIFDFPTFLLGRVTGLIKRSLMTSYTERFGLSIPEWRVLAALTATPSGSFNEVCGVLTMDRAQVSRALPALVGKGFAEQTRIRREGPRRRGEAVFQTRYALTAGGRALFRQALPVAQRHQMILLAALDEVERVALHGALVKILAAAERYEELLTLHANPRRPQRQSRRPASRDSESAATAAKTAA